ncbi:S26 family signal peptidase [Halobaculum litoreum]|uniref:S26 family signal peptidase n=1 Tax=Halobaculum litoreum TaxID=3031998 RepID=A0ABD5XXI9_9EURY
MFVGQALGQPVLVSYVETGSMAPTLAPGDGFVAVPAAVAGQVEAGDVVTFRAESVGGGGLTTHRVVDRRGGGSSRAATRTPSPTRRAASRRSLAPASSPSHSK